MIPVNVFWAICVLGSAVVLLGIGVGLWAIVTNYPQRYRERVEQRRKQAEEKTP